MKRKHGFLIWALFAELLQVWESSRFAGQFRVAWQSHHFLQQDRQGGKGGTGVQGDSQGALVQNIGTSIRCEYFQFTRLVRTRNPQISFYSRIDEKWFWTLERKLFQIFLKWMSRSQSTLILRLGTWTIALLPWPRMGAKSTLCWRARGTFGFGLSWQKVPRRTGLAKEKPTKSKEPPKKT